MKYRSFNLLFIALTLVLSHSLIVAQSSDPVFVQVDAKLGKVVYHRVLSNQTIYGIAKIYGVNESVLRKANPKLRRKNSALPAVVKVPNSSKQVIYRVPLFKAKRDFVPVYYVTRRKDNLFRISRTIFDMPTNLLVNRNDIKNNHIKEGQHLHIGWLKKQRQPLPVLIGREKESADELVENSAERRIFEAQLESHSTVSENQVAQWNQANQSKGLFVMHRSAPVKSIIEITNPVVNRAEYAKVIGRLPSNLYSKEIDMVISGDLAKKLGVVDPKVFVQVRYQGTNLAASR